MPPCCDQPEYISCQPLDTDRAPTSGGDEGYEESGRRADLGADILSWSGLGIRIWGLLGILNLGLVVLRAPLLRFCSSVQWQFAVSALSSVL